MDYAALKDKLLQFRELTEKLIAEVKAEHPDSIEDLFSQRQNIIDEIETASYDGNELRKAAEELQLLDANKQLEEVIYEKRDEMKENLDKLRSRKVANQSYYNNSNMIKSLFSKRI